MSPENLSRRTILAGVAVAAPAIALPAIAATAPSIAPTAIATASPAVPALAAANPDNELLALGAELEHVEQDLIAGLTISETLEAVREAACKLAGVPRMTYDETKPRAYWEAYVEKRNSVRG
jgi:hypothetical protein